MTPDISRVIALLGLAGLTACAAPVPQQQVPVIDPYASLGTGAIYQGALGYGTIGGEGTAEYFASQIGDTVRFEADQTTLGLEARAILGRQAEWLNRHPQFTAVIQGHSEETGTREYNLALGARRASAVQEYLIAQGVAPDRLRTLSFGKERPLAVCSDEGCYAQNRRAVTVVNLSGPAS